MWHKHPEYNFESDREDYSHTECLWYQRPNGFKHPEDIQLKFRDTGGGDFDPAPIGLYPARCIRIIDLGTAPDEMYGRDKHEVFFAWELPNELREYTKDGQPHKEPYMVTKWYTMSLAEKANLRADLEAWRGKPFTEEELQGFDARSILGAACMVNIIHKPRKRGGGVNAVITAITPLPRGVEVSPPSNEKILFSLDPDEFSMDVFETLSSGLQDRIKRSFEWQELQHGQVRANPEQGQPQPTNNVEFDDIPF